MAHEACALCAKQREVSPMGTELRRAQCAKQAVVSPMSKGVLLSSEAAKRLKPRGHRAKRSPQRRNTGPPKTARCEDAGRPLRIEGAIAADEPSEAGSISSELYERRRPEGLEVRGHAQRASAARNTAMPKARAVRTQRGDHAELSCECEALGVVRQAIAFPLYNFGNELSRAATGCLGLGALI